MSVSNLTGYTWVGNSSLDFSEFYMEGTQYYDLTFISNSVTYTELALNYGDDPVVYYGQTEVYDFNSSYWHGWSNTVYKTIEITGGNDATNVTLIAWLEANGTLTINRTEKEQFKYDMDQLADAINTKVGTTGSKTITELITAVGSITPSAPEETKTVELSMASGNQLINPTSGYVMTQVTVNKPATLVASNIKQGIAIGGVTGTFTNDADVVAGKMLNNKTVYVQGALVTGNISSKATATYTTSSSDQTISSGQYLGGDQTILAVTTSGIIASNIVEGVTVKVGDSADDDRIISVTGTAPTENTVYTTVNSSSYGTPSGTLVNLYAGYNYMGSGEQGIKIKANGVPTSENDFDYRLKSSGRQAQYSVNTLTTGITVNSLYVWSELSNLNADYVWVAGSIHGKDIPVGYANAISIDFTESITPEGESVPQTFNGDIYFNIDFED